MGMTEFSNVCERKFTCCATDTVTQKNSEENRIREEKKNEVSMRK